MKLACALTNDNLSVETYHSPNIDFTWERVAHSHDGVSSRSVWLRGRTGRQQTRDHRGSILEKRREEIITETRSRVTRAARVNAIWAIVVAGQSIPDVANIFPIINSYLLACHPEIIPEDTATVESWIPNCTFRNVRPGKDVCSIKTCHINEDCEHIDCGYVVINSARVPIEKCSVYRFYACLPTSCDVTVLLGAHVSRLAEGLRA